MSALSLGHGSGRKRVTIKEIADHLGLSNPAVSKALTGNATGTSRVSEATRERVLKAAKEMGYRPNTTARALRTGRSGMIGILSFERLGHMDVMRLHSLLNVIQHTSMEPFVYHVHPGWKNAADKAFDVMLDAKVDAVLLLHPTRHVQRKHIQQLTQEGLPVVSMEGDWLCGIPRFSINREETFGALALHMVDQGCRNIVLLQSSEKKQTNSDELLAGFESTLAKLPPKRKHSISYERYGVSPDDRERAARDHPDIHLLNLPGYLGMKQLLERPEPPDAVIGTLDDLVLGALLACTEKRVAVPSRVALAGFGNAPAGSVGAIPITTMELPLDELSRLAFEAVQRALTKTRPLKPTLTRLPCRLIVRQSSRRRG